MSRLSKDAAIYHFVTGFTSKLAGTERGITEPQPTFSTCFGEPFMPLDPLVYAEMLGKKNRTSQHKSIFNKYRVVWRTLRCWKPYELKIHKGNGNCGIKR